MNLQLPSAENLKHKVKLIKQSQQSSNSRVGMDEVSIDALGSNDCSIRYEAVVEEEEVKLPQRYCSSQIPVVQQRF